VLNLFSELLSLRVDLEFFHEVFIEQNLVQDRPEPDTLLSQNGNKPLSLLLGTATLLCDLLEEVKCFFIEIIA